MLGDDDVHKGLNDAEVRTFLAKEHARLLDQCVETSETAQQKIWDIEGELALAKSRLLSVQRREAIELLISSKGWKIHDIDEDIVEFLDESHPFIGTDREFDNQFVNPVPCSED